MTRPAIHLQRLTKKPNLRDDCLQREQLSLWFEHVCRIENPTHAAYLEGERTIPLTPYVASLLQALKRFNETPPNVRQINRLVAKGQDWAPSPWVISSASAKNGQI